MLNYVGFFFKLNNKLCSKETLLQQLNKGETIS